MRTQMFEEYQPFARKFQKTYRVTAIYGTASFLIAALFLVGQPGPPPPASFSLFGLSLAALLLLHGGRDLARQDKHLSRAGRYLRQRLNHWFPLWMLSMQYVFALILFMLVWLALESIGFPGRRWHQILLVLVIVLHGVRRWTHEYFRTQPGFGGHRTEEALRLCFSASAYCAAGGLATSMFFPEEVWTRSEFPYALVMLWIPIILLILAQVLMLLDRIFRPRG